jgi:hypothetical protein
MKWEVEYRNGDVEVVEAVDVQEAALKASAATKAAVAALHHGKEVATPGARAIRAQHGWQQPRYMAP